MVCGIPLLLMNLLNANTNISVDRSGTSFTWTDLVVAHMNRYMYILCLFFTFTLLHNLHQQWKIACIVCRMSLARNDCPTTFWHWMHFPGTWYTKWQTNYSDGLWTSCAQTSFMDIYHHQIGKSLFLGTRTEYFAESSRDE